MLARVATSAVLVPLVALAAVAGNPGWGLLVALVVLLAVREQLALVRAIGVRAAPWLAYPLGTALAIEGLLEDGQLLRPLVAAAFLAAYYWQLTRAPTERSLADWSLALAIPVGLGVLAGYAVLLRGLPDGLTWTLLLLVLVWVNDSAAFAGGRLVGHTPFFASVSPKKTCEGALCGALATVAVAAAAPRLAGLAPSLLGALGDVGALQLAALGLVVSVVAPLGDLSQSYHKRLAGAKDSGHLIPGHGGVLDRIDSFAFAAPVVYYAALLLGGRLP